MNGARSPWGKRWWAGLLAAWMVACSSEDTEQPSCPSCLASSESASESCTPCQTSLYGVNIVRECGQSYCAYDSNTYLCTASGWTPTGSCASCACSQFASGYPSSTPCNHEICDGDDDRQQCIDGQWVDVNLDCDTCECSTSVNGIAITRRCGDTYCATNSISYRCTDSGWTTVSSCSSCSCPSLEQGSTTTVPCNTEVCDDNDIRQLCVDGAWQDSGLACSTCQCSTSVNGVAISRQCSQSYCAANFLNYACTSAGWTAVSSCSSCACSPFSSLHPDPTPCNQEVCDSNDMRQICLDGEWQAVGLPCAVCECSTSLNGVDVVRSCGESYCASDFNSYLCTASGWTLTSSCSSCSCPSLDGGQVSTVACNTEVCFDEERYVCFDGAWDNVGLSCDSCQCTTSFHDVDVTRQCGESFCASNNQSYTCFSYGWNPGGNQCTNCACPPLPGQAQSTPCNEDICYQNRRLYCVSSEWLDPDEPCCTCSETFQGESVIIPCEQTFCDTTSSTLKTCQEFAWVSSSTTCTSCGCLIPYGEGQTVLPCGQTYCDASGWSHLCDNGVLSGPTALCTICGDGVRASSAEECDDDNTSDGDACSSSCGVLDQPVVAPESMPGPPPLGRVLGEGRHPVAADDQGISVAFLDVSGADPIFQVARFSPVGVSLGAPLELQPAPALSQSHPVVAAIPDKGHVAVWTAPDDDELGVWMRSLAMVGTGALGEPVRVNVGQDFGQFEPDVLWSGQQLVVAWVDGSSLDTGYDLKLRRFDAALSPLGQEELLAASEEAETHVALTSWTGSWAAAWRATSGGLERVRVRSGELAWSVGPFVPGPAEDRPALLALDEQHLLLVFTEGVAEEGNPAPPSSRLRVQVLSASQPGDVAVEETTLVAPLVISSVGLAVSHPSAVEASGSAWLAWRTAAAPGKTKGEELWLKSVAWSPANGLDLTQQEIPLPRQEQHRPGDQRRPGMASLAGGSLALVWEDLGRVVSPQGGMHEVALQLAPLPLVRLGGTP